MVLPKQPVGSGDRGPRTTQPGKVVHLPKRHKPASKKPKRKSIPVSIAELRNPIKPQMLLARGNFQRELTKQGREITDVISVVVSNTKVKPTVEILTYDVINIEDL